MSLIDAFKEDTGLDKREVDNYPVAYPTGVDPFDMASLYMGMDSQGKPYLTCGIFGGKVTMFIGHTDTGKSSAGIRTLTGASYFARKKGWDSPVIFMDVEGLVEIPRCYLLSPYSEWTDFQEGFTRIANKSQLTTERIYSYFGRLERLKAAAKGKYQVKHPHFKGEKMSVPTFVFLDAASSLTTEAVLEDVEADSKGKKKVTENKNVDMGNMTEFLHKGRATRQMMGRIAAGIEDQNIPLVVVSHVKVKKNISRDDQYAARFLPGMKHTEQLDNGKAFSDRAYHIYMIDSGTADKKHEFGDDVTGYFKKLLVSKSKSCGNVAIPIYYDIYIGIHSQISNFLILKEMKRMTESAGNYRIKGYDGSFTKKGLVKKYWSDDAFADAFDREAYQAYLDFIHPGVGFKVDDVIKYFQENRSRTDTRKLLNAEEKKGIDAELDRVHAIKDKQKAKDK